MDFKNDNIMSDENILGGSMLVKRSKRNSFFKTFSALLFLLLIIRKFRFTMHCFVNNCQSKYSNT